LHLFEFGDQQWFPQILRDAETAYLTAAYRVLPALARQWAEKISTVLTPNAPVEIVDLCAGSGGAMPQIIEDLRRRNYDVRVILTDLFPNPNSGLDARITWLREPVDAMRVPSKLTGVRTMFSAFHHFRPDAARSILKDAFEHRRAICIFESGSGTPLGMAAMLGVPLAVLVLMPLARPLRLAHLVSPTWSRCSLCSYSGTAWSQCYAFIPRLGYIEVRGIPDGLPYLIGRPTP
jgi:hypothetical protein